MRTALQLIWACGSASARGGSTAHLARGLKVAVGDQQRGQQHIRIRVGERHAQARLRKRCCARLGTLRMVAAAMRGAAAAGQGAGGALPGAGGVDLARQLLCELAVALPCLLLSSQQWQVMGLPFRLRSRCGPQQHCLHT